MKRIFLNIFSCFLALFIFVGSFVFCVPSRVSSASLTPFPTPYYRDSTQSDRYNELFNILKTNNSIKSFPSCYVFFLRSNANSSDSNLVMFLDPTDSVTIGHNDVYYGGASFKNSSISKDNLSSYIFPDFTYNAISHTSIPSIACDENQQYPYTYKNLVLNSSDVPSINGNFVVHAIFRWDPKFSPDAADVNTFTGLNLDINETSFYEWLVDTGNYTRLPEIIGLNKLKSFVTFYRAYGGSNSSFFKFFNSWLKFFNVASQTSDTINAVKTSMDQLYKEYLDYYTVTFVSNSANQAHHRKNINTVTDVDNPSLITDDPSDSLLISLLRDILRGVIAIPTSIYNNTQSILSKLDSLNFTINVSNDGGSSVTDLTPVLNKMDDIIDALGSDTVSVEIDQNIKDDTDDFFDDWNLEFKTALDSKFPVASQLRTFFTGFFERCGIDADSDGAVYQYYNPGVLTASSVSRSAGTASEADIVTEFLGKFDNSDPSFLDDASYHGVPDLSVSVGGHSVSIIDFRVYAKYRDKIHFIISFVIWTLYLLHLYKALPQIIGQVADVATKTSDL